MVSKASLKRTLMVQPLAILLLAFVSIGLLFHLALGQVLTRQSQQALNQQLAVLDAYYAKGRADQAMSQPSIFATAYVITDQDQEVVYQSTNLSDVTGWQENEGLVADFEELDDEEAWEDDGDDDWDEVDVELDIEPRQHRQISRSGQTYEVKKAHYTGQFRDFYVAATNDASQTYTVFVFVNTSPLSVLLTGLRTILLLVMLGIGLLAGLALLLTTKKVDKSFSHLKTYILAVGGRQAAEAPPALPYAEFTEVAATVTQMNHELAANHRSQQIFFQNASHELRTPLMSIQGYAEGIRSGILKDSQAAAGVIQREGQKMADLVADILQLSQLETSTSQLRLEELDLGELLYGLTWRLKPQADQKGLELHHDFEADVFLMGDEPLLERAFGNLLSNALRYAKSEIALKAWTAKDRVFLRISNDGPAITKVEQERVFERFYKGQGGQSGLGLAICRDIVQRHGGNISLTSTDQETSFTISLPKG